MTNHIDYRIIEAAMRDGHVERALAFRKAAGIIARSLKNGARTIVALFT